MPFSSPHPIDILLVDDNEADVLLTSEVFSEARVANRLHVAGDGVEALAFLRCEGRYAAAPRPDVVLLDINMPRMNGLELLEILKNDADLCTIPVVILTTSDAEHDVWRSYELQANAYITKPVDFTNFLETMRSFEQFWFAVVRLPNKGGGRT